MKLCKTILNPMLDVRQKILLLCAYVISESEKTYHTLSSVKEPQV